MMGQNGKNRPTGAEMRRKVMTAIVVKVLTFLRALVVKSSHSHDCWSEVRIVKS